MKKVGTKLLPSWIAVAIGLSFLAFNAPQKGDLVELSDWLSGRSSGLFRAIDNNRIKSLAPGTRGKIQKVKLFSRTKNYGICIDIPEESGDCLWVYYNKNHPNMQLIKEKSEDTPLPVLTRQPEEADSARTIEVVTAIVNVPELEPQVIGEITVEADAGDDAAVKTAVQNVNLFNNNKQALTKPFLCDDCAPKITSYPRCTKANDYMESRVAAIMNGSEYAGILQGKQPELIRTSCIQRALETSSAGGGYYRNCDKDDNYPSTTVVRACTSENYVQLMSKSFNAVANCLSEMVSGSESTKAESALMLFKLMSLESGLNVNAVSPSDASGPGQMTSGAIKAVNQLLPNIKDFLAQSSNPQCSQVLRKVLDQPMDSIRSKSCERFSLHKDSPVKNLIYTFGLQSLLRKFVNEEFERKTYADVLDQNLPALEKERLLNSLAAWSHNTGAGGMTVPLRILLNSYVQNGQKISAAGDVDKFLKELAPIMKNNPHRLNASSRRRTETSNFFSNINNRVSKITSEASSCLAQ